jgi:hypothetical protein
MNVTKDTNHVNNSLISAICGFFVAQCTAVDTDWGSLAKQSLSENCGHNMSQ